MSLYLYCLGEELSEGCFEGLAGVGGAAVRVVRLGPLAAVVSEAGGRGPAVEGENVLAHNRVNAAALAVSTPLPFRFGTLAARERLSEYVAANEAALLRALTRVRGCVEMGVKLMWRAQGAGKAGDGRSEAEGAGAGAGRGTAFLLAKRREMMGAEDERRRAEELAGWLAAGVSGLARETEARVTPSEPIAVRAAHLVERGRVDEYRGRVRSLAAARRDLRLLASGPWPPYSFADIAERARER